ncbi:4-hydroxybutyrate CoA-transferase [Actinomycetospora sp. NBRC 106375]|uniref:acetyl-CoA hydrolase/transferase family protein n=1 Tax=Actinomycetospora sp. NBRC 106375 TaxID=3032207 RepID=UPI0024A0F296|nr:acetyl-CoA hydrolase/transferase C-terminal domain-containing protein [Actinomycetospora sp. NBRC 106375]GLZ45109.1 4-hydroxybutyrate CoA-transferase [Actinomycetospora sp. NBRC 106375]
MTSVQETIAALRRPPEAVLDHLGPGSEVVVGAANGEPATVVDAIEAGAERLRDVRLHQMLALRERRSIDGAVPGLRHVSWFLSPATREAFRAGHCDLVPNNFSDVPRLLRRAARPDLVVVSVAPPDRHGYFSLGTNADYSAAFIGELPFFVEVNAQMPRTFGGNQLHIDDVVGWCTADRPLSPLPHPEPGPRDRAIAALVAERIPDGATLQIGLGAVPDMVLAQLGDHHGLGVHTEVLSSGVVDLVERGAVTGTRKTTHRGKIVATVAHGDQALYDFVADNAGVELHPVDYTNDPWNIAREPLFRAVNATLEVDFLGQCASESLGSQYFSSSGGQPDFARGAIMSEHGAAFIVLHSATHDDTVSRIVPQLQPGAAVTTFKNIVDNVVTEHGVAELRGASIADRTRRLIAIAHPGFRDELTAQAKALGYL